MAGITIFEPGEASSYHVHPESEEINLVLEGSGILVSEGEEAEFAPGHAMWVPEGGPSPASEHRHRAAPAPMGVHAAGAASERLSVRRSAVSVLPRPRGLGSIQSPRSSRSACFDRGLGLPACELRE